MRTKLANYIDRYFSSELFTGQEITKMLFPLILDMLCINAINMLTVSMISSSGETSVAAVSMINPLSTLILCLLNAIAAGGTVVVAQYKGQGQEEKIRESAGHTLVLTFLIALVFCILTIAFASPLVHLLYGNAESLVLSKSVTYLVGVSASLILYSIYTGIFAIFRGLGESKICLYLTIVINLSYFVFSFLFINLLHWDIMGTIAALILARLLGACFSIYYLFIRRDRLLHLRRCDLTRFNRQIFGDMIKISIPFSLEQVFLYGGSILVQKYMVELGTNSIAANADASSLFSLICSAPLAVGNLATTVIGQCIGADKRELARSYCMKLVHLGTIMILLSMVVFLPFMPLLIGLYHPTADLSAYVYRLLPLALIPMPFFYSLSNVMPYVLRSAGDATFASVVSLITMWVVRVGAGYLAAIPLKYGLEGIWVCMALEWAVRSILFFIRYKGNAWLSKSKRSLRDQ